MILGHEIFSELKIDLCFFNNTIRKNGGAYEGCNDPMKDVYKINFNVSSDWLKDERFWNKELWYSEHVLDSMQHTYCILDNHYQTDDLSKVATESKTLTE